MILKDITLPTPQENILYDEVLLDFAEAGHQLETLRFWESDQTFVVLGRISKEEDDVYLECIGQDEVPLLRRSSGGGTVLQGSGCLNYSLILSKEFYPALHDLRKSYQFICTKVIHALHLSGVDSEFFPICDIALKASQKKISGNSQKRGRHFILHHGTILYNFDLSQMERYLKIPKDVPSYRRGRTHRDFVANVQLSSDTIKDRLIEEFCIQKIEISLRDEEKECLRSRLELDKRTVDLNAAFH